MYLNLRSLLVEVRFLAEGLRCLSTVKSFKFLFQSINQSIRKGLK